MTSRCFIFQFIDVVNATNVWIVAHLTTWGNILAKLIPLYYLNLHGINWVSNFSTFKFAIFFLSCIFILKWLVSSHREDPQSSKFGFCGWNPFHLALCIATLGWDLPLHRFLDCVTLIEKYNLVIFEEDLWVGLMGIFGLVIALL